MSASRYGLGTMEARRKIERCFAVEMSTARIYGKFKDLFPQCREFWEGLETDEERHAQFYVIGDYFKFIGNRSPEQFDPPALDLVERSIEFLEALNKRIDSEAISLEQALEMALAMERLQVESCLFEIESGGDDSVVESFRKILVDEEAHYDKVKEFMIERGFSRLS
jgi:hypothetical protein